MLVTVWTASQHLVHVISSDDPWYVGPRRNRTAYHCLLLKLSTLLLVLAVLNCFNDYGVNVKNVPLFCDNESAIKIAHNPVQHSKTKHIQIRHHFLRDHVLKG